MLGAALAAYWLAYAEAHPGYEGMDALEAEAENLMGSVEWARDNSEHATVLAFTHALWFAWDTRGRRRDQRVNYTAAVQAATALDDTTEQTWATHALAVLDAQTGNIAAARAGYARALALAEELGDQAAIRAETHELAMCDVNEGKNDAARQGLERSLELGRELGDPSAVASDLKELGYLLGYTGEPKRGRELLAEAMRIYTDLGDVFNLGVCHEYWARLDARESNRDGAIQHYRQALALYEQVQAADRIAEVRDALRRLGAG